jgi:hypothetical protein
MSSSSESMRAAAYANGTAAARKAVEEYEHSSGADLMLSKVLRELISSQQRTEHAALTAVNAVSALRLDFDEFMSRVDVLAQAASVARSEAIEAAARAEAAERRNAETLSAEAREAPSTPSTPVALRTERAENYESDAPPPESPRE